MKPIILSVLCFAPHSLLSTTTWRALAAPVSTGDSGNGNGNIAGPAPASAAPAQTGIALRQSDGSGMAGGSSSNSGTGRRNHMWRDAVAFIGVPGLGLVAARLAWRLHAATEALHKAQQERVVGRGAVDVLQRGVAVAKAQLAAAASAAAAGAGDDADEQLRGMEKTLAALEQRLEEARAEEEGDGEAEWRPPSDMDVGVVACLSRGGLGAPYDGTPVIGSVINSAMDLCLHQVLGQEAQVPWYWTVNPAQRYVIQQSSLTSPAAGNRNGHIEQGHNDEPNDNIQDNRLNFFHVPLKGEDMVSYFRRFAHHLGKQRLAAAGTPMLRGTMSGSWPSWTRVRVR